MIQIDLIQDALSALRPDTPNWYGWAKVDSDGNKIPNNQRMQTKYVIIEESHIGKVTRPTNEEINAKIAELQAEYEANQYQRDRASAYPSTADQLDMLYHQGIDGWKAEIKKVKDQFPKPE